jgi:hypothetical protein
MLAVVGGPSDQSGPERMMNLNPAHIHLLLNHIPVFGSIFSALLIAWGLLRKSEDVLRLGLALAFVIGLATYGVMLTGDPAADVVRNLADVTRERIHAHEEAADWATWLIAGAGVVSLVALLMVRRRRAAGRTLSILALVVSLFGFAAASRAALLGGEIRHPEARPGFVVPAEASDRPGAARD